MSRNKAGTNRRKVLKSIGAGTTSLVAGSSTAVARTSGESVGVPDNKLVNELLATAGNPDLLSARTVTLGNSDATQEKSLIATEVRTENGTLAYAEVDGPNESGLLSGYFRFDSQESGVPAQFRDTPRDTEVTLVYEEGKVHPRRSLTEKEKGVVEEAVDANEEAKMIYEESSNNLYVISEEQGRFKVEIEQVSRKSYLQRPITPAFKSGKYTVGEVSSGGVSTQGDDCFDAFGPCPACVAGSITCAGCAATCATGPGCAACLILTCGFAGGACGCCAMCADSIPDPENAVCPD